MIGRFRIVFLLILFSSICIVQAKSHQQHIECPVNYTKILNVCYKVLDLEAGSYDSVKLANLCQEWNNLSVLASFHSDKQVWILREVLRRNFIFSAKFQLRRKWRRHDCGNFKCQASIDNSSLSIAWSSAELYTCACTAGDKIQIKAEENIGILCKIQPLLTVESDTRLPQSTFLKEKHLSSSGNNVPVKKSATSTKKNRAYLKIKGYPCGKYDAKRQRKGQTITFSREHTIYYRTPKWWTPGKYVCVWNLKVILRDEEKVVVKRKEELGTFVKFRRLFIAKDVDGSCNDTLTVAGPNVGFKKTYEENCRNLDTIYKVNSDTVQLRLIIDLQKNRSLSGTKEITTFAVQFSPILRDDIPRRYMVENIPKLFPDSPVKGNNFTWPEARKFCQQLGTDKDLCSTNTICPRYSYLIHSSSEFKENEGKLEYLPTLQYYNFWMKMNMTDCKSVLYGGIYDGPQPWGYGSSKCPIEGCRTKKSIVCCERNHYSYDYQVSSAKTEIAVTSLRIDFKKYRYRFDYLEDEDDRFDRIAHGIYEFLDWHPYGRVPGDIIKFALHIDYTQNFSTPVYFCRKNIQFSVDYTYKISLRPCYEMRNWDPSMYMYTSLTPQPGTRRLYVASNSKAEDEPSRISITPPCCGYDEVNFIMYGFVEDEWIAGDPTELCQSNKDFYDGPSGEIASPTYPKAFSNFLDCSWTITVRPGYGIFIRFSNMSLFETFGCGGNYLEFIDGTTNISLGRLCGNKAENFVSPSNVLVVRFSIEPDFTAAVFLFTYDEVPVQSAIPIQFSISSSLGTWPAAADLCDLRGMTLCRSEDICFVNSIRVEVDNNAGWVAVRDRFNEWVHIRPSGYSEYTCKNFSSQFGPPEWGLQTGEGCVFSEQRPQPTIKRYMATQEPEFSNVCTIKRDLVYCCLYDKTQINKPDIEFIWPPPKLPVVLVRVYVSLYLGNTMTYYRFATGKEWSSPEYEVEDYDDYHFYSDYDATTNEPTTVTPWKLPSTVPDKVVVDYFTLSSDRQQGHFEQVIYFCSYQFSSFLQIDIRKEYKMSLQRCDTIRGWKFEFFLYAAIAKTDLASVPLFITSPRYNYGIHALYYGFYETQNDNGFEGKHVSLTPPSFDYSSKFTLYVSDAGILS